MSNCNRSINVWHNNNWKKPHLPDLFKSWNVTRLYNFITILDNNWSEDNVIFFNCPDFFGNGPNRLHNPHKMIETAREQFYLTLNLFCQQKFHIWMTAPSRSTSFYFCLWRLKFLFWTPCYIFSTFFFFRIFLKWQVRSVSRCFSFILTGIPFLIWMRGGKRSCRNAGLHSLWSDS